MQTTDQTSTHAARLGPNHGYAIDGDVALLHADVRVPRSARPQGEEWALQLWACDAPHAGGPLRGVKVTEAALSVAAGAQASAEHAQLATESKAQVPGGLRDYSMVLVLASGTKGSFDQVHDFANYPDRQRFMAPHLEGVVGYRVEGAQVVLRAERVRSPRLQGNLSGSLRLELRALANAYRGGPLEGTALAAIDLGRLNGQNTFESIDQRVAFDGPKEGEWQMVLLLREWVDAVGFVTRDYCNFTLPYIVGVPELSKSVPVAAPTPVILPATAPAAATAKAAAPAIAEPAKPVAVAVPAVTAEAVKPAAVATAAQTPAAKVAASPSIVPEPSVPTVSIMLATVEELAKVPGLDRKLAAGIVSNRPYKSVDDLAKVRGIGASLLATLRKMLTV